MLSGAGTAYPSGAPDFTPDFKWGSCYSIFSFMCMFCRSLFVLLSFFFLPLCCLSFDLQILITSLVSSNSSYYGSTKYQNDCGHFCHVIPVNDERCTGFNFVLFSNLRRSLVSSSNLTPSCDVNYYRITNMGA
jgi:hypothetical protein